MMVIRLRIVVAISHKNNSNNTKGYGYYKQLIIFEKKNLIKIILPIVI